jgi:hypothetical protein
MNRDGNMLGRLYSARAAIAYAISLDGEVYGPLLDRIEQEIAARRDGVDVIDRAMSILNEPDVRRFAVHFAAAAVMESQ